MKLRIQGNSLRLRLSRKEVAQLHDRRVVECQIEFSPGRALAYAVRSSSETTTFSASFDGQSIVVCVPATIVTRWAEGEQVSIEGPAESAVQLLIEKDFQCMHKPGHQDPDAYPNPLAH